MRPASVVALVIVVYSVVATCVRCTAQANSTDASGACRTLCERLGQAGQLTSSNSQGGARVVFHGVIGADGTVISISPQGAFTAAKVPAVRGQYMVRFDVPTPPYSDQWQTRGMPTIIVTPWSRHRYLQGRPTPITWPASAVVVEASRMLLRYVVLNGRQQPTDAPCSIIILWD